MYAGEQDAHDYELFYPRTELPHTGVLDPETGERLKSWNGFVDADQMEKGNIR